ncbi:cupredoxin domain-containing protein [Methylobacterium nigriterrae]|uniref:cupredoxin domain-containing protein n=1 Tax=Methylobacterium nigriterrae TaxID=3127512 RepID=UPI003013BC7E
MIPACTRGALAALFVLSGGLALAEEKPSPQPKAGDAMPPVELTIDLEGGKPRCSPAELRLPAETNVALRVVNRADRPVTLTAPGQFENRNVLHADGDLVHVMSNEGYLVKQGGTGTLKLRTLAAGQYPYACTGVQDRVAPFKGTLILAPSAG